MKRFLVMLLAMVMIPYVTTLAWTGRIWTDAGVEVPAEEFLVGVVAAEIPAEYGIETLKAQAVLARTYIYRLVDPGMERIREEIREQSALGVFHALYVADQTERRAVSDTSDHGIQPDPLKFFHKRFCSNPMIA